MSARAAPICTDIALWGIEETQTATKNGRKGTCASEQIVLKIEGGISGKSRPDSRIQHGLELPSSLFFSHCVDSCSF
jgi:hypothetical protein